MNELVIQKRSIKALCELDPIFPSILQQYGPPPNYQRPEGFETLVRIILEQQVSLESAYAAYQKLKGTVHQISPQAILTLNDQQFRAAYVSRQKTVYLRALAEAVKQNNLPLDQLRELPESEIREKLVAIKGIGNWTADVYLMFALQKPDIFPIGDIAAVNAVKTLKAVSSKEEVLAKSEVWSPYRTAATFFLWHYYLKVRNRKVDHLL